MNEMIDKFIMGVEPLDQFDGYGRRWKAWASSSKNFQKEENLKNITLDKIVLPDIK